MKKIFALLIAAVALSGCQSNTASTGSANKPATTNSTNTNTAAASTPLNHSSHGANHSAANISASPEVKTFEGTGIVTKINLELVSVELNHDEIKGLMPAMIMEFYVTNKKELEALKVGDKVSFTLEENNKSPKITKINKIQ